MGVRKVPDQGKTPQTRGETSSGGRARSRAGGRPESATFVAYFPPIQSAIKSGPGGMRIQLGVREMEMGNAVKLIAWMDRLLKAPVQPHDADPRKPHGRRGNPMKQRWRGRIEADRYARCRRYPPPGRDMFRTHGGNSDDEKWYREP